MAIPWTAAQLPFVRLTAALRAPSRAAAVTWM